ncbi:MAG TPA: hypothetical protein DCE41_27105 [Cytophagales bacterium]|nr:hypothetical protein [Cytophagales bacterium]HAA23157.1 hypothetical protein [Cytophagales bacterium]HAP61121.1 hypothetical protein [Cytophagales bacterium]
MENLLTGEALVSFLSLSVMEIVLGIDNIIFISILTQRLPESQQGRARRTGILLALIIRIGLLFGLTWLIGMTSSLFSIGDMHFSGRDLILLFGGLFLVYKATTEIHEKLEGGAEEERSVKATALRTIIVQIVLLDIVFSFDSILTAIGLAESVYIMIAAVIVAITIMLALAKTISDFIQRHPTIKMLALSFLLLIGVLLILDAFHQEVPKGYIYAAIFFSLFVELLNIRVRKSKRPPVDLRDRFEEEQSAEVEV